MSTGREVLYHGGTVLTLDPARPRADALAARGTRIVAVGSVEECRASLGDPAPRANDETVALDLVDLRGGALVPGFNDAHLHPLPMCFYEQNVDLDGVGSLPEVFDRLVDRAREAGDRGWVVGFQVAADALAEGRLPTRRELDGVAADRPVVLVCRDGHTVVGNTATFEAAGVDAATPDPPGGVFERDSDGSPTGRCYEHAGQILLGNMPAPDIDALRDAARVVFGRLAAHGITSIGAILQTDSEGPAGAAGELEWVGMQLLLDELALGLHCILGGGDIDRVIAARDTPLHDPERARVVGGAKIYLDGTLGARTACLHSPYADDASQRGLPTIEPAQAAARMEKAHLAGLQVCVHAIGDAANTLALDLFEQLLERHPAALGDPPTRHRIEHASVLDERSIDRFAELGVTAVVQPLFLRSEHSWLADRLGDDRRRWTYPFRSLADAGVSLAGSSDAPIEQPDVLAGMQAAITRHGFEPGEALTVDEALALYTSGAARAQRRDDDTGTLEPGKRADLVVLSQDPASAPLEMISVRRTVAAGSVVHDTTSLEERATVR